MATSHRNVMEELAQWNGDCPAAPVFEDFDAWLTVLPVRDRAEIGVQEGAHLLSATQLIRPAPNAPPIPAATVAIAAREAAIATLACLPKRMTVGRAIRLLTAASVGGAR